MMRRFNILSASVSSSSCLRTRSSFTSGFIPLGLSMIHGKQFVSSSSSSSDRPPKTPKRKARPSKKETSVYEQKILKKKTNSSTNSKQQQQTPITDVSGNRKSPTSTSQIMNVDDIIKLSKEQQAIVNAALEGHNIFMTGSAGTGKSLVTQTLIRELSKKHNNDNNDDDGNGSFNTTSSLSSDAVRVGAPTGVAAMNIGGTTLHSLFKFKPGQEAEMSYVENHAQYLFSIARGNRLERMKTLIIDEISMVTPSFFEALALICRTNFRVSDEQRQQLMNPFGSLQLIVCGDFLQLPPVVNKQEEQKRALLHQLKKGLMTATSTSSSTASEAEEKKYCFQTEAWKQTDFKRFDLTTTFRQAKDVEFSKFLNGVRLGRTDVKYMREKLLMSPDLVSSSSTQSSSSAQSSSSKTKPKTSSNQNDLSLLPPVKIRARNEEVNRINAEEFAIVTFENQQKEIALKENPETASMLDEIEQYERPTFAPYYHAAATGVCSSSNHSSSKNNNSHSNNNNNNNNNSSNFSIEDSPVVSTLQLQRGTKVMLLKNLNVAAGLVNGRLGTVVDFQELQPEDEDLFSAPTSSSSMMISSRTRLFKYIPVVQFEPMKNSPSTSNSKQNNHQKKSSSSSQSQPLTIAIAPYTWEIKSGDEVKGTVTQIPLRHAWAITAHKSQGLTLDRVEVDLKRFFEAGQGYVALSRARSADGLKIVNQLQSDRELKESLKVCPIAAEFQKY